MEINLHGAVDIRDTTYITYADGTTTLLQHELPATTVEQLEPLVRDSILTLVACRSWKALICSACKEAVRTPAGVPCLLDHMRCATGRVASCSP